MTDELQAEVVPARPRRLRRMIVPLGCGLAGAATGAFATAMWWSSDVRTQAIVIESRSEPICDVSPPPVSAPVEPAPPLPAPISDVGVVISVGGDSYVELDTESLPRHAAPTLIRDVGAMTSVAEVAAKDLPEELRAWKKRTVSVDGTCEARVTGFAVIGRLNGAARDAEENLEEWTSQKVLEYGRPALFARFEGCSGTFARNAELPAITVLADTNAPGDLADRALERFAAAPPVVAAQDSWREADNSGTWYEANEATVETHVMRHPRTGVMWVLVHAYLYNDCGHAGGNIVGLYRVESGRLVTEVERSVSAARIEHVIDLEGDGEVELVGSSLDSVSIERADGREAHGLGVASYGCGC